VWLLWVRWLRERGWVDPLVRGFDSRFF